jgi:chromosome partitioning protein
VDGALIDWVIVRNRLSMPGPRNKRPVGDGLTALARRLGYRLAEGMAERVIYREFFPRGLTALDDLDETILGTRPSMSHVSAREEVMQLLSVLRLPLNERGRKRAAARAEWLDQVSKPLEMHDLLAET